MLSLKLISSVLAIGPKWFSSGWFFWDMDTAFLCEVLFPLLFTGPHGPFCSAVGPSYFPLSLLMAHSTPNISLCFQASFPSWCEELTVFLGSCHPLSWWLYWGFMVRNYIAYRSALLNSKLEPVVGHFQPSSSLIPQKPMPPAWLVIRMTWVFKRHNPGIPSTPSELDFVRVAWEAVIFQGSLWLAIFGSHCSKRWSLVP